MNAHVLQARQALYEWRSKFQKAALTYMESRTKDLSKDQVEALVEDALRGNGELYWEVAGHGDEVRCADSSAIQT